MDQTALEYNKTLHCRKTKKLLVVNDKNLKRRYRVDEQKHYFNVSSYVLIKNVNFNKYRKTVCLKIR